MTTQRTVAVAVSGGRDSVALLHCTVSAAQAQGLAVVALHVHHGLQAQADVWAEAVESICAEWAHRGALLHFSLRRLTGPPAAGASVEAWARRARYRALAEMARAAGTDLVLLAHHRRDQAETFLLQALRGAGPAGLSAMPRTAQRDGIVWARPWLGISRQAIDDYAQYHRLRSIDDPSNADARFDRSRLRSQVMPQLRQAFDDAETMLAHAAARCAQAQAVLAEVASDDLLSSADGAALDLAAWHALSEARRRNLLRAWVSARLGQGAAQSLIDRLMRELPGGSPATWPCGPLTLRRYRGRLRAEPVAEAAATALAQASADIDGPGSYSVPGQGSALLQVASATAGGVRADFLRGAQWRVRSGGERFQRAPGTPARSLKKQFQAAGIAAWQRDAPLLFAADGRLLFVPALGIDARVLAAPGESQFVLRWLAQR